MWHSKNAPMPLQNFWSFVDLFSHITVFLILAMSQPNDCGNGVNWVGFLPQFTTSVPLFLRENSAFGDPPPAELSEPTRAQPLLCSSISFPRNPPEGSVDSKLDPLSDYLWLKLLLKTKTGLPSTISTSLLFVPTSSFQGSSGMQWLQSQGGLTAPSHRKMD